MSIKKDEITTDITLELDEDVISISDFQKATINFLSLVKEVSKQVSRDKIDKSDWSVKVYSGSSGLGVLGCESNLYADKTREAIVSGIRSLSKGIRPAEFTDHSIECVKNLASLFKKKIDPTVRIWSKSDESIIVGRNIAAEAEDLLASAYEVDSSVDGILKCVDGRGKLQFVIYDLLDDHAIKCEINSKNLLDQALSSFKKRVEVIGVVRYRKDGVPVGVTANKIINYPDKSQIPSLEQIRILLSNNAPI